jgi:hypothetical protein
MSAELSQNNTAELTAYVEPSAASAEVCSVPEYTPQRTSTNHITAPEIHSCRRLKESEGLHRN